MQTALPTAAPPCPSLLLVSIGPVQDFIASARRCQDLWFGSWLLSQLSVAAAEGLAAAAGEGSLIFPAGLGPRHESDSRMNGAEGAANKILLLCPADVSPKNVAAQGRASLDKRLQSFLDVEFHALPNAWNHEPVFHREVAERQLSSLVEFSWVAVRVGPGDDAYATARLSAESWLAARKTTRDWSQPTWIHRSFAPKCSLDGDRDSVLGRGIDDAVRSGHKSIDEVRRIFGIKPKEQLSGIGLLKRLGQQRAENQAEKRDQFPPPFHSTSHIASGPTRTRLARSISAEVWQAFLLRISARIDLTRYRIRHGATFVHASLSNSLATLDAAVVDVPRALPTPDEQSAPSNPYDRGLDGVLLFPSRAQDLLDEAGSTPPTAEDVEGLQADITSFLGDLGLATPFPYLAVLLADGDKMGDMLNRKAEGADGQDKHRLVSDALTYFTKRALDIVERHAGSLIYAGGDDVLALVPVHTALLASQALSQAFGDCLKKTELFTAEEAIPTLSVGLGVGHHMERLPALLDLARAAERLAKVERNSLAILVDKRSGGRYSYRARWDAASGEPVGRLHGWMKRLEAEQIPDGVAHELEALAGRFEVGTTPQERRDLAVLIRAEAARIVGRKKAQLGTADLAADTVALLEAGLTGDADPTVSLRVLADELQVARLFLRAHNEAWGPRANLLTVESL